MTTLTSQQRLLRTLAGQSVDRIPILSMIPWNPLRAEPAPGDWTSLPNFRQLIPLVRAQCDFLLDVLVPERESPAVSAGMAEMNRRMTYGGIFDRRFLLAPPVVVDAQEETLPDRTLVHYFVHAPGRDLTYTTAVFEGDDTVWDVEPLVKSVEDAEALLAIPYSFDPPDLAPVYADRDRLGEQGLTSHFISTPWVMVSQVTGFERALEWTLTEPHLLERMVETAYERIAGRLRWLLGHDTCPLFHFGGSEQATPPMMPRRLFDRYVTHYDGRLWRMVRDAGKMVWVHCHGKIATVLDAYIDGGVQLLDPVEPPPQGDIEIGEAKRRVRGCGMTLIGGIQWSEFASATPAEVERMVKHVILEEGKQHYILGSTAGPGSALSDGLRDNIMRYLEAGAKYGAF